jgi:hypothetical protein
LRRRKVQPGEGCVKHWVDSDGGGANSVRTLFDGIPERETMRVQIIAVMTAVAFAASPAAAQNAAELLGAYHMTMTSKAGSNCPDGQDEDLSIDIRRISGEKLTFGEVGKDGDDEIAQYDPVARSFRFEQAASDGGNEQSGVFTGQFTRQPDSVRLDMTIAIENCTGKLTGFRPAPQLIAPPAAPATPAGPAAPAAAAPAASPGMSQLALYGGGGLALLVAGLGIGWLAGRRKAEPPPAAPPASPPPDASDDEG